MPLNWPGVQMVYGDLPEADRAVARIALDGFAGLVAGELATRGMARHLSPLWKPWQLLVAKQGTKFAAVFASMSGGMPDMRWISVAGGVLSASSLARFAETELGWVPSVAIEWEGPKGMAELQEQAAAHVDRLQQHLDFGKLGDLSGLENLVVPLRTFMKDHPLYERNVFVMMRFADHPTLVGAYQAVKSTLAECGFDAVRADDRDYTGEVWSNIQTYMHGCSLGLAIVEDFTGVRDFNPNVSLELGYMLARQKRVLILKEKTLPSLPTDVVNRLYRPFDMFNLGDTISSQVSQWVHRDLGVADR